MSWQVFAVPFPVGNVVSWSGMFPEHNCVYYVALRLNWEVILHNALTMQVRCTVAHRVRFEWADSAWTEPTAVHITVFPTTYAPPVRDPQEYAVAPRPYKVQPPWWKRWTATCCLRTLAEVPWTTWRPRLYVHVDLCSWKHTR